MENNHFITKNTALTAYLISQGFELQEIETNGDSSFIFEDVPKLKENVMDFQCAKAEGNIVVFYQNYKKLLNRIKVEQLPYG